MRVRRRVALVTVVAASAFAACVTGLSTTQQELVTLSMGSNPYDFGTHPLGTLLPAALFELDPATATDNDDVTMVTYSTGCAQYHLTGPSPIMGTTPFEIWCEPNFVSTKAVTFTNCTLHAMMFSATFDPMFPGEADCEVDFTIVPHGGGGTTTIFPLYLKGSGQQASVALDVSPPSIQFTDIPSGGSSSSTMVTVSNQGTVGLWVNGTNTDSTHFVVTPALGSGSIAAGSAKSYGVYCDQPANGSQYNAILRFTGSAGIMGGSSETSMLTCNGILSSLSIQPNPVAFGNLPIGAMVDQMVTISTMGSGSGLTVSLDGTAVANQVSFVGSTGSGFLGSGGSQTVTLRYQPTVAHAQGVPLGNLSVLFARDLTARNVALSGAAGSAAIATNPANIELGPMCAGGSASETIAVYASDTGDVDVSSITPPATTTFGVTPTLGGHIIGGHAMELALTATATPTVAGDYTDKIVLHTNVPGDLAHEVGLHAVALPPGIAPTPDLVHFGVVAPGQISPGREIVLTNCGDTPITIGTATITGVNAAEFAIVSPADLMVTIPNKGSQAFLVLMTPHAKGAKAAQLVFDYGTGTAAADLDGTSLGTPIDRDTYYGCSTGRSDSTNPRLLGTAWPIALALLGLRRRRRGSR